MTQEERDKLIADIAAAVRIRSSDVGLSEEEVHWVRNAIKLQEQSLKLRQALIEKSLSGLIWAGIIGIFYIFLEWAKAHGYKS